VTKSNQRRRKGSVIHGIGVAVGYSGLDDLGDWFREPVFWYGIVAPVGLLVIVTLYLFWLDWKAGKLYRLEVKQKDRRPRRKSTRNKFR
jgi:hypothetical protein